MAHEILLARTIWFLETRLLNPQGLAFGPAMKGLVDRYQFLIYPSKPEDFEVANGIRYQAGSFDFNGKQIAVFFTVYNTGWVADTLVSTDAADAFLEDLQEFLAAEYQNRRASELRTRVMHESQLELKSDVDLTRPSERISKFANALAHGSGTPAQELRALHFGPQDSSPTFSFERRENVPDSERRYFSRAALPTHRHIELLEEFQRIFA